MLSSTLSTKSGFHTTYSTQISLTESKNLIPRCTVRLFYILPPRIIVDPYELANYKKSFTFSLSGTSNLELPVMAVNSNGSALLLNISLPKNFPLETQTVTIEVPLHVRYGEPLQSSKSDDGSVQLSWPTGFWTCPSSCKFHIFHNSRIFLTFQEASRPSLPSSIPELMASFDPSSNTLLLTNPDLHLSPETIQAPIGDLADLKQVEIGTAAVIVLAFIYLLHVSCRTASGIGARDTNPKIE